MALERTIDAATLAAISNQGGFFPIALFFIDWPDAPFRVHTNLGSLTWGGETWTGIGKIANVSLPGDANGMAKQEGMFSLLGLNDELDAYLDADARGRAARVYFGAVTECDGSVLVGEPFEVFSGTVDGLKDMTEAGGGNLSRGVQVPLVSGPSQRSSSQALHSYSDQIANFPGDTAGRLLINSEREGKRHRWPE